MKVKFIFAWYDLWVGIFYDRKKNWIYILPLPMLGIIIQMPRKWRIRGLINRWRLPNYGTCLECKRSRATHDYNGHQHYVCEPCYDSLNREFDEEYR